MEAKKIYVVMSAEGDVPLVTTDATFSVQMRNIWNAALTHTKYVSVRVNLDVTPFMQRVTEYIAKKNKN